MTVIDDEGHTVLATVTDGNPLFQQMFRYVFNKNDNSGSILKRNSNYVICKTTDPENDTDYLEMWGSFTDGYFFTMRSPLASIRESAALANQFLIYLGVTGAVLGRHPGLALRQKDHPADHGAGKAVGVNGRSEF